MDKTKPNEALSGRPIGRDQAKMKRHRRGRVATSRLGRRPHHQKNAREIMAQKGLAASIRLSRLRLLRSGVSHVGQLTALKEMALLDMVSKAEDLYSRKDRR
jgi:hypothetical protein